MRPTGGTASSGATCSDRKRSFTPSSRASPRTSALEGVDAHSASSRGVGGTALLSRRTARRWRSRLTRVTCLRRKYGERNRHMASRFARSPWSPRVLRVTASSETWAELRQHPEPRSQSPYCPTCPASSEPYQSGRSRAAGANHNRWRGAATDSLRGPTQRRSQSESALPHPHAREPKRTTSSHSRSSSHRLSPERRRIESRTAVSVTVPLPAR